MLHLDMDAFYAVGRAADPPHPARPAGAGRRARPARRGGRGQLPGPGVRSPLGDADGPGPAAVPARGGAAPAVRALPGAVRAGDGRAGRGGPGGRAGLARRGVPRAAGRWPGPPRRRSSGSAPRCGPRPRGHRPAGLGRRRLRQAARQDRLRAGQAGRAAGRRPGPSSRPCSARCRCGRCGGSARWPRPALRRARRAHHRPAGRAWTCGRSTDLLGGAVGTELHRLARGIDDRPVAPRGRGQAGQRRDHVRRRPHRDGRRARRGGPDDRGRAPAAASRSGRAARTVTVKVRSAEFTTATRSETAGHGQHRSRPSSPRWPSGWPGPRCRRAGCG